MSTVASPNSTRAPSALAKALRALAALLNYPSLEVQGALAEIKQALQYTAWPKALQHELHTLLDLLQQETLLDWQVRYTDAFEQSRSTSLHIFEHVHGDSRERGAAMIDLQQSYEQQGVVLGSGELPDFLPVILEFASMQNDRMAREFLSETAHIVETLAQVLHKRQNPFLPLLSAVLAASGAKPVASTPVQAWWSASAAAISAGHIDVAELAEMDANWDAPPAFDGCSNAGQNAQGALGPNEHPVQFVKSAAMSHGSPTTAPGGHGLGV